jgi:hypothetical protein
MRKYRCTIYLDHGFGKSGNGYIVLRDDSIEIVNKWNHRTTILDFSSIHKIVLGGYLGIKIFYEIDQIKVITLQVSHQEEIRSIAQKQNIIVESRGLMSFIKERRSFISGLIGYFKYYLVG